MKAVRVHQYGGPEALKYEEVPMQEPGEGEARVKIEAIGVNFLDIYQRIGRYQGTVPFTLGQEAAGTVDALGSNVADIKPGDRVVYASVQGSYAEYANVAAWRLIPVPAEVDAQDAIAIMVQGMTAHYLTHSTYPIKEGDAARASSEQFRRRKKPRSPERQARTTSSSILKLISKPRSSD